MRRTLRTFLLPSLLVFLASCSHSCSGITARQEALLPALRTAWVNVKLDVERGIDSGRTTDRLDESQGALLRTQLANFDAAVTEGIPAKIAAAPWAPLRAEAEEGITYRVNQGQIGTGVASSLRERLRNFTEAVNKFLARR
jgi:hypothetical protein